MRKLRTMPQNPAVTLDAWGHWQHAGGSSASTIYLRRRYLERLAQAHDLLTVTPAEVAEWLATTGADWSPETRKSAQAALRSFYGWAVAEGLRQDDPMARIRRARGSEPSPRPTADQVWLQALLEAQGPDRAMLLLAATCGLRRAEIARVHTDDYADGMLRVLGKGGKVRQVPVPNAEVRALLSATPGGYLFPGRFGGHVVPDYVGKHLSRLLGPGWSAHSLRHRYASKVYAGGRDLFALQRLLGHASPETTQRYVATDRAALEAAAKHAAA
jgi:integrase/recombinase XerC